MIRTHLGPTPIVQLSDDPGSLHKDRFKHRPGDLVTHFDMGGLGIVISVNLRRFEITVLWMNAGQQVIRRGRGTAVLG